MLSFFRYRTDKQSIFVEIISVHSRWIHQLHWIPRTVIIRRHPHILLEQRIDREPSRMGRVEVACTIVVEPCLLVQLLGVEEVRGVPRAVALLDEDLAVRDVGHVLGDLAVDVGHEGGGAEVIDVVEADIIVLFSHHFPWGLARLRRCQWRGLTRDLSNLFIWGDPLVTNLFNFG